MYDTCFILQIDFRIVIDCLRKEMIKNCITVKIQISTPGAC